MVDFTPHVERARHDALVERARRATAARPLWLLCPREALATAFELRVARAGGGFVRRLDWAALVDVADDALGLPCAPSPPEPARVAYVETALAAHAATSRAVARALAVDSFAVAAAALGVVDDLRLAGWDGDAAVIDRACDEPRDAVAALVRGHLELLAGLVAAFERALADDGALDLPARLRRIAAAAAACPTAPLLPTDELFVDGVDRLEPLERAVLERVAAGGTRVDVAAWVVGWRGKSPRPRDLPGRPATALEAYARGVEPRPDARDDDSIVELVASDPDDEAEGVARWLAAAPAAIRARVALVAPPEPGYAARVARALGRYGVAARYVAAEPVYRAPLWQVVRASVRLAWRGPDAIDLATVLSAPGAGIWGADRDRLCARLREHVPTSWDAVRDVLAKATDPAVLVATEPGTAARGVDPARDVDADVDPARVRQLELARERVAGLVTLWETAGPIARRPAGERRDALETVVEATLARFANPMRLQEAFPDARTVAAWTSAARAIADAARAVVPRLAPQGDASAFLGSVERLLGTVPDTLAARREDPVPILVDTPFVATRPDVLVVLGFQRGRYPAPPALPLLLGPVEREALARASALVPGLAELADDGARATPAERDARRALALPSATLVVVAPRRDACGRVVEPALARRDLLASYPAEVAAARLRHGPRAIDAWARARSSAEVPPRAALRDAVALVGARDPAAPATVAALVAAAPALRDVFACRFRPDRAFALGRLVRHRLAHTTYTPASLDGLLTCRYAFLTRTLLGLRGLPLARSPALATGDRAAVAHAALRALDALAPEAATASGALERALDDAVAATVPWAARGEARLELEELRRTVRGFLARYVPLRARWRIERALPAPAPPSPDATATAAPVTLALGTTAPEAPRVIRVAVPALRVEARAGAGVVVDLRLGGVERLRAARAAGLGAGDALLPAVAEGTHGVSIAAVAHLSLARAEGEVLAASASADAFLAPGVALDPDADLERVRAAALARVSDALDAVARDDAELGPHSPARRAELERAGVRSCEYCAARLGCRFQVAPVGGRT